jgi:GT2 family glycosyltransferase
MSTFLFYALDCYDGFMNTKKVFVILLNWNNWRETKECLESINHVTGIDFEVVLVDNNSLPEEKETLRNFQFSIFNFQTKFIWNDSNLGFAGGNNVGIKYALEHGADYVMLLNNDAVAAPDFLSELVKVAESDPSFGIVGARIYKYGTNDIVFGGGKINKWFTSGEHMNTQHATRNMQQVDYITGAAMLVKKEVIEKVGLMREEYFLYYEDVDWCIRARKAGYKCVLVPISHVWHKVSATNKEGSPSYIYYHTRNSLMLALFNGNIIQKIVAYISGAWILVKQAIKLFVMPSKHLWATSMARGVIDFYRGKYGKIEFL